MTDCRVSQTRSLSFVSSSLFGELVRDTILTARPDVRGNQPRGNLLGVAIRCGQDQPDEYGKLAGRCNTATSQTRRPLGHLVKIQKPSPHSPNSELSGTSPLK